MRAISFIVGLAALAAAVVPASASAAGPPPGSHPGPRYQELGGSHAAGELPSPPRPPAGRPVMPTGYHLPVRHAGTVSPNLGHAPLAVPAAAKTWGAAGSSTTLVLYDTTGDWDWLGELYAIGAGNLATHFGTVTAEPVVDYVAGQVNDYTATIYLGSTYNEPLPAGFLSDVLTTTRPVIWAGDNIWQLSGPSGSAADSAFQAQYGWDPATSYFDTTDTISSVTYNGTGFSRSSLNTAGVLAPHITTASQVTTLASADCTDPAGVATDCGPIAQTTGTSFPWAISSGNLLYIGEVPLSYISQTDRYVAFAGLLLNDLDPVATTSHLALIRLDDIDTNTSPADLEAYISYLQSQDVPFSMAVIPDFTFGGDPFWNLATAPDVVSALQEGLSDGGTLVQDGDTAEYPDAANPFDTVSGDDFEFYRAQCSATDTPPYDFQPAPCPYGDYVIEEGPLPGDSQSWAQSRVLAGQTLFGQAGLPTPAIWTTPLYGASAPDYAGISQVYATKYEEEMFFGGELSGQPIDYSHVFGQFFPYEVHDLYGSTVIPENLGEYLQGPTFREPAQSAQDILDEAQQNLALPQGVASLYLHPETDPLSVLEQLVTGLKAEGYTFVSPQSFLAANG
jgi:uncharacterized protein YdaL